jgi:hypothetical protein
MALEEKVSARKAFDEEAAAGLMGPLAGILEADIRVFLAVERSNRTIERLILSVDIGIAQGEVGSERRKIPVDELRIIEYLRGRSSEATQLLLELRVRSQVLQGLFRR